MDLGPQSSKLKEVIQEKQMDINVLYLNLDKFEWIIKYLEKINKHLEDQQAIMELQNIRETRQAAKRRKLKLTSFEQEINTDRESWLERANIHMERRLEKANKYKALLRHMAYHYTVRNKVCKARIRSLMYGS